MSASKGRSARNKGKRGERDVRDLFIRDFGLDARRGGNQSRDASNEADVEGTPWWVEVKRSARPSPRKALEQAQEATDGRMPIAVTWKDREGVIVTVSWKSFVELSSYWLAEKLRTQGDIKSE